MQRKKIGVLIATIVAAVAVVGAALYIITPGYGKLAVMVHDAPCADCSHVWVTFQSVEVHASNASGGGWATLNVAGSTLDLMALNGTALAKEIGIMTLKAGHYEQIRLAVTNVTVMLTDGTKIAASIPAAMTADVDSQFNISSGATTTISIDINLSTSLHIVTDGTVVTATFTPDIGSVVVL
jgi:uncharacterized protein DUF4382